MSSVEPQTPYTEHVGNGVTTAFSYEFQLLASDDLIVTIDDVVIPSSDFVLTGVGNQAGGDVTFTVAPVNGAVVLLSRTIALKRDIDYQYNGALAEQTVDLDFNRLWQALQGAMAIVGGAIRAPFPEQIPALPKASARANTLLGFDASGNPIVTTPSPTDATAVSLALQAFINSISDSADPASADALLALKRTSTGGVASTWHAWLEKQPVNPRAEFGVVGDGVANDYAQMVVADAAAAALGGVLVLGPGRYRIDTNLAFSVPVVMEGGVFTGSGTISFPAGFSAPAYYCFDCLVGPIRAPVVLAEWFGARRATTTPTGSGTDIATKAWNSWPAFINGGNYVTEHNYGDGAFLAANKPFSNGDTWDAIALQRALWSFGDLNAGTGVRGEVRLLAGDYYLNKPVRWTGIGMSATMRGAGRTMTCLHPVDLATHQTQPFAIGACKSLLTFFQSGPEPIFVADLTLKGPSGMVFGSAPNYFAASCVGANGVTFENCWFLIADTGVYLEQLSNDIWIRGCMFEYCFRGVFGYDASWCQIVNSGFWQAPGTTLTGVDVAIGYAFITGCTFVSLNKPFVLGLGSHLAGVTVIEDGTGHRNTINGRDITRRMAIAAGATRAVLGITLGAFTGIRTRMVVGGIVQGAGGVGMERTLTWYRDGGEPTAAGAAPTKWGNVTAQGQIAEAAAVVGGTTAELRIVNSAAQPIECDVTVTIEGSDYVLSGF